jgi:hypothetical protein
MDHMFNCALCVRGRDRPRHDAFAATVHTPRRSAMMNVFRQVPNASERISFVYAGPCCLQFDLRTLRPRPARARLPDHPGTALGTSRRESRCGDVDTCDA